MAKLAFVEGGSLASAEPVRGSSRRIASGGAGDGGGRRLIPCSDFVAKIDSLELEPQSETWHACSVRFWPPSTRPTESPAPTGIVRQERGWPRRGCLERRNGQVEKET